MTATHVSERFRCKTKDCPWPKDEEIHVPWCLHIQGVSHRRDEPWHQHWPKKGMGAGRTEARIVAVLCSYCSDKVDNTPDWDNSVSPGEDGAETYILWDTQVEGGWVHPLIERRLEAGSAAAEARGRGSNLAVTGSDSQRTATLSAALPPPSAAAPSASGEDSAAEAGKQAQDLLAPSRAEPARNRGSSAAPFSLFSQLTHEERMGIAAEIRREQKQRQWKAGDTANLWERETTEAWQYLDEFGYTHPALSNIMHVCENIPGSRRREPLSFAHHTVIHTRNAEDQEAWLDRCEQEGWTVREFRVAVHGEKPKVKRWTLEELEGVLCDTCRAAVEAL